MIKQIQDDKDTRKKNLYLDKEGRLFFDEVYNSQKKRIRQDSKRNIRNKSLKSELKTTLKSIENGDVSSETKNQALKSLDVAFSKGVISKNFRDRNKSRISSL